MSRRRGLQIIKIGIVTEGDSEVGSLGRIYDQLEERIAGIQLLKPVFAPVDPQAPVPVIARGLAERIRLATARGADRVVVLLDLEDASTCLVDRTEAIERTLGGVGCKTRVVMKHVKFENWLVAATGSLEQQPQRFPEVARVVAAVVPNRADSVTDAEALLKRATPRSSPYEKVQDSARILERADIGEMARNSRSFRRFLAVLGDGAFVGGSRLPKLDAASGARHRVRKMG